MANHRKKTAVERIKLSLWAKKREADKRALREVAAKQDSLLVNTGQKKPQTGVVLTAAKAFANFIRAGFGSRVPVISLPQATPVQTDEHAVAPVVARPRYITADGAANASLYRDSSGSDLRGLLEEFNRGNGHSGWRMKGRQ